MARPKRSTSVELVNEGSEDAPRKAPAVRTSKTRAVALAKTENKIESMVRSMFTNSLKEVERVVKLTDSSSVIADRVSTGSASLDLTLGGGLAPGFHQYSGEEASGKTTGGLMFLASAIRDTEIGSTVFFDAEGSGGCLIEPATYSQNGVGKTISELFDLAKVDKSLGAHYVPDQEAYVDTASNNATGTELRRARLYYGGLHETTEIIASDGTKLIGYMHPVFVLRDGNVVQVLLEDLVEGDVLLRKKLPNTPG